MNSDRQACGLGTLFPMSCRGPAEAFARSLQSRLQSLGRGGASDTPAEDERSWLNQQHQVTNHQPRLSSSSESDIYYDFDVECESPAEETEPDFQVTKPKVLQQLSIESGCFPSPLSANPTVPDRDSSDPDLTDSETSGIVLQNEGSPESSVLDTGTSSALFYSGFVEGPVYRNLRRGPQDPKLGSADGASYNKDAKLPTIDATDRRESWKSNSNEGSSNDEFFECDSPKAGNSITESLSSLCLHDSGYPNTAESSRCNSQNETHNNFERNNVYVSGNSCLLAENLLEVNNNNNNNNNHSNTEAQAEEVSKYAGAACQNPSNEPSADHVEAKPDTQQTLGDGLSSRLNRPKSLVIESSAPESIIFDNEDFSAEHHSKSDEDEDLRPTPRVRRCSSLKTGKTPPGTPSRKKIVRFADVLGLDLADVRTFLDEVPKVPKSAYEDLECADLSSNESPHFTMPPSTEMLCPAFIRRPEKCLIALFQQPGGLPDFMDSVRENQVRLENAVVSDAVSFSITGTVRVRNLDFHKSVHVRYTLDGWETFADLQATYVPNSCDGFSDKFSFLLYAHTVRVDQRLEFAIRFQCKGTQFWDNNRGKNYVFQCLPASVDPAPVPIAISPDFHTFY